jgi:hypothetical protein
MAGMIVFVTPLDSGLRRNDDQLVLGEGRTSATLITMLERSSAA